MYNFTNTRGRAVDPPSFYADPDPTVFRIRIQVQVNQIWRNRIMKSFLNL